MNITTILKHSKSKMAWNVIGTTLGAKYKVAIVPYFHELEKEEAMEIAEFISKSFNDAVKPKLVIDMVAEYSNGIIIKTTDQRKFTTSTGIWMEYGQMGVKEAEVEDVKQLMAQLIEICRKNSKVRFFACR